MLAIDDVLAAALLAAWSMLWLARQTEALGISRGSGLPRPAPTRPRQPAAPHT